MMGYEDERIIALRRKERKRLFDNVKNGIYVKEQLYTFKEVTLFEETLFIMLPEGFILAAEKDIAFKYPSVFRPQIIVSDVSGKINFTFSEFDQFVEWEQLPLLLQGLQTVILNTNPSVVLFHSEKKDIEDHSVPWIDFKSYSIDGPLYNFVFLFLNHDKTILGMFNCPYSERRDWNILFIKCIETIKTIN